MNQPEPTPAPAPLSYSETLTRLLADKWTMVSEGPSGAQLKRVKRAGPAAFIIGIIVLLFYWPAGLIIVILAAIEQAFFAKERTFFLSRDLPQMPPPK